MLKAGSTGATLVGPNIRNLKCRYSFFHPLAAALLLGRWWFQSGVPSPLEAARWWGQLLILTPAYLLLFEGALKGRKCLLETENESEECATSLHALGCDGDTGQESPSAMYLLF